MSNKIKIIKNTPNPLIKNTIKTKRISSNTIKTKRISSNTIINKNKLITIHRVFDEYLIFKNNSAIKFNQNKDYIDLMFKDENKKLLTIYKDFKQPLLSSWKRKNLSILIY